MSNGISICGPIRRVPVFDCIEPTYSAGSLADIHGDNRSCVGESVTDLELPLGFARLHGRFDLVLRSVSLLFHDLFDVLAIEFYRQLL